MKKNLRTKNIEKNNATSNQYLTKTAVKPNYCLSALISCQTACHELHVVDFEDQPQFEESEGHQTDSARNIKAKFVGFAVDSQEEVTKAHH